MEQGIRGAGLDDEQRDQAHRADRERGDGPGGPPAPVGALLDREDQREERDGEQHRAGEVEPWSPGRAGHAAKRRARHRDEDRRDGERDPPDPAPARGVGQHSTDQRPDREGDAADGAPDPEGEPLPLGRIGDPQGGHRCRHQKGAADALGEATEDDHPGGVGGGDHDRRGREDDQPDDHRRPLAEHVAEPARRDDEARHREQVDPDRPAQLAGPHLEVVGDRIERGVDRRGVDPDQKQHGAGRHQHRGRIDGTGRLLLAPSRVRVRMGNVQQGTSQRPSQLSHRGDAIARVPSPSDPRAFGARG